MRALVVGSEGYLGRHVVQRLRESRHMVSGMDLGLWEGQEFEPATLRMSGGSDEACGLVRQGLWDVVIYLGAVAHDPEGTLGATAGVVHTMEAPARMAGACGESATALVFVSSLSVFDRSAGEWGAQHGEPQNYPRLKSHAEEVVLKAAWPKVAIVRFGTLYGAPVGLDSYREHLLLNSMCLAAARGGPIKVRGPELVRPVTFIRNASLQVEALAEQLVNGRSLYARGKIANYSDMSARVREFGEQVVAEYAAVTGDASALMLQVSESKDSRSYGEVQGGSVPWLGELVRWSMENKELVKAKRYKA